MIRIEGLHRLMRALQTTDLAPAQQQALEGAAQRIAGAVQELLSHAPGSDHATPWLQTGALRDSIGFSADADAAVVGSNTVQAVHQEHGTARIPPRPFFAPAGAACAEGTAAAVGRELAGAVEGLLR